MDHHEFVAKYRSRKISISIDRSLALEAVRVGLLGKSYYISQIFFSWIWIIGLVGGVILIFLYKWWVGLLVVIISLALPGSLKDTAAQGIRDKLIEDSEFFDFAQRNNLFKINNVEDQSSS
jgi:hypothetical protein